MCRVLVYLGKPLLLETLLYSPDSSLIKQAYNPRFMTTTFKNLAGFGMAAWDESSYNKEQPYLYKVPTLPFYDSNLKNIAEKIKANCMLSHVRGVDYNEKMVISRSNTHPFLFDNTKIAFAHNGSLKGFEETRYELASYMEPEYKIKIEGITDSEWLYALFLSRLKLESGKNTFEKISAALFSMLEILKIVRKKHNFCLSSPLNFFFSDGEFISAMRYSLDFGHNEEANNNFNNYSSLWYTYGKEYGYFDNEYKMKGGRKKNSIIIASEPLTEDYTTWVEVPEYSFIFASLKKEEIQIQSIDMDV